MAGLFHAVSKQQNPLGTTIQSRGSGRYTFGLALSAGLAGLLYGYDTVSISGAIEFLRARYTLGTTMEGLVISSIIIGAVIGAASSGFLSDRYGRKRILMIGGFFFLVSALWSALTLGPYDLITARVVGGYGIGLTAALAVTYITESAPTDIRGTLAFSYQMLAVCGIFLTNVINYIIASYGTFFWDIAFGWRWMLGLGAIPAAIFIAAMWHAPESPRFLIQQGRPEEGFNMLEQIMGTEKARVRTEDIQASVRLEQEMSHEFTDLFRPGLRKALVIGIFLAICNQAVGMNAISYYGPVMFSRMGFGGDTEFLAAACVGGVELTFTVVGLFLIDSIGRKRLLEWGSLLMFVFAMGIAGSYFSSRPLLTLVFVMLFTGAFAVSVGPIPWIVIPELFPTFLRGRATGLCVMALLFANGIIAQFTPLMIDRLGGGVTFLIFGCADLMSFIGVLVLVPETMGRTLEEIDHMWQPKTPLAAAKYMLSSADANIRHAEATMARVENERLQAMGIMEAAERARISAQKTIFAIEAEHRAHAERLSADRLAEDARRAAHTVMDDTSQPSPYPDSTMQGHSAAVHASGVSFSPTADGNADTVISTPIPLPGSSVDAIAPHTNVPMPDDDGDTQEASVPMPDDDGDTQEASVPMPEVAHVYADRSRTAQSQTAQSQTARTQTARTQEPDNPDDRIPDLSALPDTPVRKTSRNDFIGRAGFTGRGAQRQARQPLPAGAASALPESAMPTIPLPQSAQPPQPTQPAQAAQAMRTSSPAPRLWNHTDATNPQTMQEHTGHPSALTEAENAREAKAIDDALDTLDALIKD